MKPRSRSSGMGWMGSAAGWSMSLKFAGAALEHGGVFGGRFVGAGFADEVGVFVFGAEPAGGLGVDFGAIGGRDEVEVCVDAVADVAEHEGGALDAVVDGVNGGFSADGADLVSADVDPLDGGEDVDAVDAPEDGGFPEDGGVDGACGGGGDDVVADALDLHLGAGEAGQWA